jgi:GNAT superfamily N-acetyltransferase
MEPPIDVTPVPLQAILGMREDYRRELRCQIVHDSWHVRGFTTSYLLRLHGQVVGYGSVGGAPGEPRDTLKEFFVFPAARAAALLLIRRLILTSEARWIEAQTNDPLLQLMLYDCATDWTSDTILFADLVTTAHPPPGAALRRLTATDHASVFPHTTEPVGDWGLEHNNLIVATGGLLFHYNPPYGDLFMEVAPAHRGRGYATYLVQELKRICYELGRVPAARCSQMNHASRGALTAAGMLPCARILRGRIAA